MSDYDREDLSLRGQTHRDTFEHMVEVQLSRRGFLTGTAMVTAGAALASSSVVMLGVPGEAQAATGFTAIGPTTADTVTVPPGYSFNTVIAWGDPLFPGQLPWGYGGGKINQTNLTAAEQAARVGYNHDMLALFANPFGSPAKAGTKPWPSYIVALNNEYATAGDMIPDFVAASPTKEQVDLQLTAQGVTIFGMRLVNGKWTQDRTMRINEDPAGPLVARRITALTPIGFSGPAANDPRLAGGSIGTFGNCAGGFTPWGTYLTCEENFNFAFGNLNGLAAGETKSDHLLHGVPGGASETHYELFYDHFDVTKDPNGPFKYGWVSEIDPYDPAKPPVKRSALGRFKHEAATVVIQYPTKQARIGTPVLYMGDDERFDYVYKFVANGTFNLDTPRAPEHFNLLDQGTLYVARFEADGSGKWLPLTTAKLDKLAPGKFADQGDICIRTRQAADIVHATPMDRPEDVEAPIDARFGGLGKVYVVLTNNSNRGVANRANRANGTIRSSATDGPNPRGPNPAGQVVEITEAHNDHTLTSFKWRLFLLAGDPAAAAGAPTNVQGTFIGDRFGAPDNCTFDKDGRLWLATDGSPSVFNNCNDQVVCTEATIPGGPVVVKRFLVGPKGCEVCGPLFSPDSSSFFCNIQHPGEGNAFAGQSHFPLGGSKLPRPAMVAVRKYNGDLIGS